MKSPNNHLDTHLNKSFTIAYLTFYLAIFLCLAYPLNLAAQDNGETLFKQTCAACHTVNGGKLVGPDLVNVHQKRNEDWLIEFIKSSKSMIDRGDPDAVAIYEEYNKVLMPDQPTFTDEDVKSIIAYISNQSGTTDQAPAYSARPLSEATQENISNGEKLFTGKMRLLNGGASCNSCHNVVNDGILAGGSLSLDLTEAFTRLNEGGLIAILKSPPFPVMKKAYENTPLTESEAYDIAAFLKNADETKLNQQKDQYSSKDFVYTGIGGIIVLLVIFAGVWRRRKKKCTNHEIYQRQEEQYNPTIIQKIKKMS